MLLKREWIKKTWIRYRYIDISLFFSTTQTLFWRQTSLKSAIAFSHFRSWCNKNYSMVPKYPIWSQWPKKASFNRSPQFCDDKSQIVTKKPAKEGLLKLSITVFIVTAFTSHKTVTNGYICDRHNIKAGRHKKSQKEQAKTRLLKLSKINRIVTALSHHNMESQMVRIVTVTMRYLV
jgi:phosphorylcholine metabolism protein LicD